MLGITMIGLELIAAALTVAYLAKLLVEGREHFDLLQHGLRKGFGRCVEKRSLLNQQILRRSILRRSILRRSESVQFGSA